jgi:hypothetical protein
MRRGEGGSVLLRIVCFGGGFILISDLRWGGVEGKEIASKSCDNIAN